MSEVKQLDWNKLKPKVSEKRIYICASKRQTKPKVTKLVDKTIIGLDYSYQKRLREIAQEEF